MLKPKALTRGLFIAIIAVSLAMGFAFAEEVEQAASFDDNADESEEWIPVKDLDPDRVELKAIVREHNAWVQVTIIFPNSGYDVEWGEVEQDNNTFIADTRIEADEIVLPVVTEKRYRYELGELDEEEEYRFVFQVWGEKIDSIKFSGSCIVESTVVVFEEDSPVIDESYPFSAEETSCACGNNVEYRFEWDDVENLSRESFSEWSETPEKEHSWSDEGEYNVRVQARCSENPANASPLSDENKIEISEETRIDDWNLYY